MTKLLSSEQLEERFRKLKEKRQKQHQLQLERNKQELKELYRKVDDDIKLEKQRKKQEIINQFRETPLFRDKQSQPKSLPIGTVNINNYQHLVESELYTKDELINIETLYPNEYGRICWEVWNRLVEQFRQ